MASLQPGDAPVDVDLDGVDRPMIDPAGPGTVMVWLSADTAADADRTAAD
jgi:hypothetical protein